MYLCVILCPSPCYMQKNPSISLQNLSFYHITMHIHILKVCMVRVSASTCQSVYYPGETLSSLVYIYYSKQEERNSEIYMQVYLTYTFVSLLYCVCVHVVSGFFLSITIPSMYIDTWAYIGGRGHRIKH